tara:strand:- start:250 stop:453 length:204 start_codon:yes stop_codon:yes gene_type:complete
MPAATATASSTTTRVPSKKTAMNRNQSRFASTQSRFATAKLIQNLGSSNEGVQFNFVSDLRMAYGRD